MPNNQGKKSSALEWYYKHREEQIKKNREWKIKNRKQMLAQKKEYHYKNRDKIIERKKQYRLLHQEKLKEYRRLPHVKAKSRERVKLKRLLTNRAYDKMYYKRLKETNIELLRAKWRKYHKNNPRSSPRYPLEVQLAMNNVRKRDHNTCQWYGCGLTSRQAPIHVHHIFPRSEHPELETVEQYMICYCMNHHANWHRYRGDDYSKLISPAYQEGETSFIRGRD